jgi:hypothetical protein
MPTMPLSGMLWLRRTGARSNTPATASWLVCIGGGGGALRNCRFKRNSLAASGQPEQILVFNVVAELCIGKGLAFQALGDVSLRGFDQPIRVHAVEWPNQANSV